MRVQCDLNKVFIFQINKKNIGDIVICDTISCVPVSVIIYCSHITLSSINIALVLWFRRWKFILNSIPILYTDRYVSFSAGRFVNVCSLTKCPRGKIFVDCINYSQIYFTRTVIRYKDTFFFVSDIEIKQYKTLNSLWTLIDSSHNHKIYCRYSTSIRAII